MLFLYPNVNKNSFICNLGFAMKLKMHHFLRSTALGSLAILYLGPLAAHAFNPMEAAEVTVQQSNKSLPSTAPLLGASPKLVFPERPAQAPNPQPSAPLTSADAALLPPAIMAAQSSPEFIAPTSLLATPEAAAPLQSIPSLQPTAPIVVEAPVAPAPADVAPTFADNVALPTIPTLTSPATAPSRVMPEKKLSDASKAILSKVPSKLNGQKPKKSQKTSVTRMDPALQALPSATDTSGQFDVLGLSIQVQRPGLDSNFELNRAYNALVSGDSSLASEIYKNILIQCFQNL